MTAAHRQPGNLGTLAGQLAGYDPQNPPARLHYAALEKLLTHDMPAEEAEDWRDMLRRAVWQDDIDCRQTGILPCEDTGKRRPLYGAELDRTLAVIRAFKGMGPRPDNPPIDSENPEKAPQNLQNLTLVSVDLDGPFDDIGPTSYGIPIGLRDGGVAQVHIRTEFRAASVRNWLRTLSCPTAPPLLLAWIDAATPHPTQIGYDELIELGFPATPEGYEPYVLKPDGLYAVAPDAPGGLSYAERRALHPSGTDYAAPALRIPCAIRDFVEFLESAEFWEVVGYPNQEYSHAWADLGLPDPAAISALLAEGEAPPTLAEELPRKPQRYYKKAALIEHLEPCMREPGKLQNLLSNASKNKLGDCRTDDGWDLGKVAEWLLRNGKLKSDFTKKHINQLIEKLVNSS